MEPIPVKIRLYPAYYPKFRCIAQDCRNDCCHDWNIFFSKKDYLKIKRAEKSPQLEQLTAQAMGRIPDGERTEDRYGEFHTHSGACPFQNEEGLCRLQLELGEGALPNVCRTFPRLHRFTPMGRQEALSTGCEAVVQLLWDAPEGLDFVEDPLEKQQWKGLQLGEKWDQYPIFHSAVIDILQARQFSIPRRLLILGLMLEKAAKEWDSLDAARWQSQVELLLGDPLLTESLEQLPGNQKAFLAENMRTAALIAAGEGSFLLKTLEQSGAFFNSGTDAAPHVLFQETFFEEASQAFRETFGDIDYFFENLLVNTAFLTAVPSLTDPEQLWKSYVTLCGTYSFFRFLTILCCGKEPTKEKLFQGVVLASRALLHNKDRQARLRDQFFQTGSQTLAHMAVLVKE